MLKSSFTNIAILKVAEIISLLRTDEMKNLRTCPKCLSLGFTPPTFISKILSEIILFSLSTFLFPAYPG